uniref:Uncharacterized protein MANES_12G026600 n=1 Tax=Rhizophora mucronata TaxID=61149 RepID=A0A2P2JZN2_RHIMU
MSRDQCIKALAERARILPLVTLTGLSLSLSLCMNYEKGQFPFLYLLVIALQCGENYKMRTRTFFKLTCILHL